MTGEISRQIADIQSATTDSNFRFFELFSLLIHAGNSWRNGRSAGLFRGQISFERPEITKFPVKFPDSREFLWRLIRSAPRRRPGQSRSRRWYPSRERKVRCWRAWISGGISVWCMSDRAISASWTSNQKCMMIIHHTARDSPPRAGSAFHCWKSGLSRQAHRMNRAMNRWGFV
jgi:hypothetical protein